MTEEQPVTLYGVPSSRAQSRVYPVSGQASSQFDGAPRTTATTTTTTGFPFSGSPFTSTAQLMPSSATIPIATVTASNDHTVAALEEKNRELQSMLDNIKSKAKGKIQELQTTLQSVAAENEEIRKKLLLHTQTAATTATTQEDSQMKQQQLEAASAREQQALAREQEHQLQIQQLADREHERQLEIQQLSEQLDRWKRKVDEQAEESQQMEGLGQTIQLMKSELVRKDTQIESLKNAMDVLQQQQQQPPPSAPSSADVERAVEEAMERKDAEIQMVRKEYERRRMEKEMESRGQLESLQNQLQEAAQRGGSTDQVKELQAKVDALSQDRESWLVIQTKMDAVEKERDNLLSAIEQERGSSMAAAKRVPELEKALEDNRRLFNGSKLLVEKLKGELAAMKSTTAATAAAAAAAAAIEGSSTETSSPRSGDEKIQGEMVAKLQGELTAKTAEVAQMQLALQEKEGQLDSSAAQYHQWETRWKEADQRASSLVASDVAKAAQLEQMKASDAEKAVQLVQLKADLSAAQQEFEKSKQLQAQLQESESRLRTAFMDLDGKNAEHSQNAQLLAEASSKSSILEARLVELETQVRDSVSKETNADELSSQNREMRAELIKASEKLGRISAELGRANAEVDQYRSSAQSVEAKSAQLERWNVELESTLNDLQNQLAQREKQIINLSAASSEPSEETKQKIAMMKHEQQEALKQLVAERQKLEEVISQNAEKGEMIEALERQIVGLHKGAMLAHTKEQEVQKLKDAMELVQETNASLEAAVAGFRESESIKDQAIASLKRGLFDLQANLESEQKKRAEESNDFLQKIQELRLKSESASSYAKEVSTLESSVKAKDQQIAGLQTELAEAQERVAAFHDQCNHLSTAQSQISELQSQGQAQSSRIDELTTQLDALRGELSRKDESIHGQSMELDRAKEENATLISGFESEISAVKAIAQEKTNLSRNLQAEVHGLQSEMQKLQASTKQMEETLATTTASLQAAEQKYSASKHELDSLSQGLRTNVDSFNAQLAEKQSMIATLSKQLAISTTGASKKEDLDRLQQEWLEKYRVLEQENIRLRDRSLRSERMLDEYQRSSNPNMRRTDSNLMMGVATLPWLETKEEDDPTDDDLEAPLSNQPIRPRGGGCMFQRVYCRFDLSPVVRVRYFAQRTARRAIRIIDRQR